MLPEPMPRVPKAARNVAEVALVPVRWSNGPGLLLRDCGNWDGTCKGIPSYDCGNAYTMGRRWNFIQLTSPRHAGAKFPIYLQRTATNKKKILL
ncbi:hypothetical protein Cob_v004834 [Colletotrichum orbiculare MAFF 240422]|uniref:Uncharacterized protein n=1 Tax=Colletotrichum orbiculare (strain 104-T / ATCC 96160 / CBS 514.97 / LARS 414 / MAFF 240422) TaxID=1213857 RepID=A0A484FX95_COLOR|nr:hypothetical protein Cob_v004834 [Colletotrichum orbiculare MAFF 240422]